MLHDAMIAGLAYERRNSARRLVSESDLVVVWHHEGRTPVRYSVLDVSEGGARVLSSMPLVKGMSGSAVKLLPGGTAIMRPCQVSWMRPASAGGSKLAYEVGLTFA